MPTFVGPSPAVARVRSTENVSVSRMLVTVYARERLEDAIRAVAEDAISPSRPDGLTWHAEAGFDEAGFDDELGAAVRDIAASTNRLLAEALESLLETAPPSVRGRISSVPRWPEQA
jgi:hypothetical protein